jgi:N-acetylglucosamine malate deacetylase 1
VNLRAAVRRILLHLYAGVPGGSRAAPNLQLYLMRFGDKPRPMEGPPSAERVLVLAPHPDDETLGCGGLVHLLSVAGAEVSVVVLTDGGAGDPASKGDRAANEAIVSVRRQEMAAAASVLGVAEIVHLDLPDGELQASDEAVGLLRGKLQEMNPDLVLLPFPTDQHPDHFETNVLFVRAGRQLYAGSKGPECWGYETWTPLYANTIVDISKAASRKWAAIAEHRSQSRYIDYAAAVRGLNTYRSLMALHRPGFAEAFYACPFREYAELVDLMNALEPGGKGWKQWSQP